MKKFSYLALSPEGTLQKGEMEAFSFTEVVEKLREKSLIPVEVKEKRFLLSLKLHKDRTEELLFFTEQLRRLLQSGVSLEKALHILKGIFSASGKKELERIAMSLGEEIKQGTSLSQAMSQLGFFPDFYVHLIMAGEMSGALPDVLADLALYLKEKQQFRQELVSALLYPSFLLVFGLLSVQTILVYVIPRFATIFDEMGIEPPMFTKILILAGSFWKSWGWLFLVLIAAIFIYVSRRIKAPEERKRWELFLLRLPYIGQQIFLAELARFFRALAVMLKGGVSIEQALSFAARVPTFGLLKEFFENAAEEIKHGKKLSILLRSLPGRTEFIFELVSIGEETGDYAQCFEEIATMCEEEVREATKHFLSILEPATILFFGFLLGGMIISILVSLFNIQLN